MQALLRLLSGIFVATAGISLQALGQQSTVLDNTAQILAVAAFNPVKLVELDVMGTATPSDRQLYRTEVAPCFAKISTTYRNRLPDLQRQLDIVASGMPHHDAKGTPAYQAVVDSLGYIRASNIGVLSITRPHDLMTSEDFQFNRKLHDELIRMIQAMPPGLAEAVSRKLSDQFAEAIEHYKPIIRQICGW